MMFEGDDGGQAFPVQRALGMSLRDYLAGQVIGSAGFVGTGLTATESAPLLAKAAYVIADAMIAEKRRGEY